jgi:hypothetical protein
LVEPIENRTIIFENGTLKVMWVIRKN